MLKKILFLTFLLASVPLYSYIQDVFYLMQIDTENITNRTTFASFTNILIEELARRHYYILDGINPGPEREEPNYMISGNISYQGDRYAVELRVENITNRKDRWEDSVYTTDLKSMSGFREAARAIAFRTDIFRKGRTPGSYRERTDYEKIYGRAIDGKFKRTINHIEMLNFLNASLVFPTGYDAGFPLKFSLDFFEYAYVWVLSNTTLGIGAGAKVFSYHAPTAMSFLSLAAYVPIFVFPDDYDFNRKDLFFCVEAGFFIPQYSYIDLNLKLIFNGMSIMAGWLYQPYYASGAVLRNESWTIYGGLTFSFGKYTVKWQ